MKREYKVWNIIEFGISPKIVESIFESGATIDDILECNSQFLMDLKSDKQGLYNKILQIIANNHSKITSSDSVYCLLSFGLTLNIISILNAKFDIFSIDELKKKINGIDLSIKIGQKNSLKIKRALMLLNEAYENRILGTNNTLIDIKTISEIDSTEIILNIIEKNYPITIFKLKNILNANFSVDDISINESIQKLLNYKKIQFSSEGYIPKLNDINQFINNVMDIRKQEMLLNRLSGDTLESIALKNNISRERVRQIIDGILEKRNSISEDKFKKYFMEYDLNEFQFSELFGMNKYVYNLFSIECKKGNKSIFELAKDLGIENSRINEINYFVKENNDFIYDGRIIKISVNSIIDYLLEIHKHRKFKYGEFFKLYEKFVNENLKLYKEKLISNERNFNAICERSSNVLICNSSRIKFYRTEDYDLSNLQKIFEKVEENSFISTDNIFLNNRKIMKSININDQYELHSLLRKLYSNKSNRYVFHRMPMIQIGNLDKKEFVIKILSQNSPITIKDFTYIFKRNYGYDINSFKSYLLTELSEFIYLDILNSEFKKFTDEEIVILKESIKSEFILIDELSNIISKIGLNPDIYINNQNIKQLGYSSYSTYCISDKHTNIEKYFKDYLLKFDRFDIDKDIDVHIKKIGVFNIALNKLLSELIFIQIDENYYVKLDFLIKTEITKDYLSNIISIFEGKAEESTFVTIDMVDKDEFKSIEDNEIDLKMIVLLIKNASNLSYRKIGDVYLFSKLKSKDILKEFIGSFVNGKDNYKLFDIRKHIKGKYSVILEEEKIKEMIMETNLFYSSELDAVFQNKENYLKEIYANEEFTFE